MRSLSLPFLMLLSVCVATTMLLPRFSAAADRPNIVVFLSDDHTATDSSLYGSRDMDTPQMQRIAEAGMTFERAFVASPSCAPSRASLLTGLMPARHGAERNHAHARADIKKLPAYLHELGYEVAAFGKVGHYGQTKEYGFDVAEHLTYHDDVAVDEAIKWLNARESEKPLCLFIGTNWPHVPWPKVRTIDEQAVVVPGTHVDTRRRRVTLVRGTTKRSASWTTNWAGRLMRRIRNWARTRCSSTPATTARSGLSRSGLCTTTACTRLSSRLGPAGSPAAAVHRRWSLGSTCCRRS